MYVTYTCGFMFLPSTNIRWSDILLTFNWSLSNTPPLSNSFAKETDLVVILVWYCYSKNISKEGNGEYFLIPDDKLIKSWTFLKVWIWIHTKNSQTKKQAKTECRHLGIALTIPDLTSSLKTRKFENLCRTNFSNFQCQSGWLHDIF